MNLLSNFNSKYLFPLSKRLYSSNQGYVRKIRKINRDQLIWFPGHINKGINQMNQNLAKADLIIEIHDARIPFTGRTDLMSTFSQVKPRILVLNKVDLIPQARINAIRDKIHQMDDHGHRPVDVFFTQINDIGKQSKLLAKLNQTITDFISADTKSKLDNFVLVGGLPNVGKSTFINGLRNWNKSTTGFVKERSARPTRVGINAGVTRSVSERILLCEGPPRVYILDSPGVWEPSKENIETVLKLALCGCLNFDSIYKEHVIDYMLYWLNEHGEHDYVSRYDMPGPTDDVLVFLQHICKANQFVYRNHRENRICPLIHRAADTAFRDFNKGALGKFVLDDLCGFVGGELREENARFAPLGSIFSAQIPKKKDFPFEWDKNKF